MDIGKANLMAVMENVHQAQDNETLMGGEWCAMQKKNSCSIFDSKQPCAKVSEFCPSIVVFDFAWRIRFEAKGKSFCG
jgi:hypothetical protein